MTTRRMAHRVRDADSTQNHTLWIRILYAAMLHRCWQMPRYATCLQFRPFSLRLPTQI